MAASALSPGDLIAQKYRLGRKLGEGAMGVVYQAVHERLKTPVALKFLHKDLAERPGLAARFVQEGQLAASIHNPHVAAVWDADTTSDGIPFLVMELLEGEPLRKILDREKKLKLEKAIDFTAQILAGLEAAHALGIVHRDLKPDNAFVHGDRQGGVLKLIDFGIAKLKRTQEYTVGLTLAGTILGTPEYMAPEQVADSANVDQRADVYSVGAMLYEMLSGKTVVTPTTLEATLITIQLGQIVDVGELEPALPKSFATVVMRALCVQREQRYQSAHEFRLALRPFAANLSYAGELALRAPANAQPGAFAQAAAPKPDATEQVAPEMIQAELARAGTFPAPTALQPQSYGPARPKSARRSNTLLVILGVSALLLGVAIGVAYILQRPTQMDPLANFPSLLPTAPVATSLQPEVAAPEVTPTVTPPKVAPRGEAPRPRPTRPTAPPPTSTTTPPPAANTQPPPYTLPLPSGLPSGFPTSITLPPGFPTAWPTMPGSSPTPLTPPAASGSPQTPPI